MIGYIAMRLTRERIRNVGDALAYYADCAIATYEDTIFMKKYSKADRRRARTIATDMVQAVKDWVGTDHCHYEVIRTRLNVAVKDDPDNQD